MNSFISMFPPLAFVLGPWLLLGLALSGPFLVLLTVIVAATAIPAIIALPFLLVRRLRIERMPRVRLELARAAA